MRGNVPVFQKTRLPWLRCNHRQTPRPRNRPRDRTTSFSERRNRQNSIHSHLPSTKPCNQKSHLLWPEFWREYLHSYLQSFLRFWTLSIERFWLLFWFILNGVTLKTSNSCDHISTNGKAPLHSHINHSTPQFLYSLWRRANARNVSFLNLSRW